MMIIEIKNQFAKVFKFLFKKRELITNGSSLASWIEVK